MQRRAQNGKKVGVNVPPSVLASVRQSAVYVLALAQLDALIVRRAAEGAGRRELASATGAEGAGVQTLPVGNHGETLEVTKV